jgi:hypothetical protein
MEKYLFSHQINIANYMASPENDRMLLYHSLGSGKTFTSLACARLHIHLDTVVITGGGYTEINFQRENFKFNEIFPSTQVEAKYLRWKTLSNKCEKDVIDQLSGCFIIVDEVHNLRAKNSNFIENKCYYFMRNIFRELLSRKVSKIILLTGTPIVDDPKDINSIMGLMDVDNIFEYTSRYSTDNNYTITDEGEYIGGILWPLTLVEMKGDERKKYIDTVRRTSSNNFCRGLDDCTLRSKYEEIIKNIKNGPKISIREKAYIYCERVNGPGINTLIKLLNIKTNWKYIVLTNETKKYNFGDEKIENSEVVVGSNSSCESINIYDLSQIHIITPHWNASHISQAIGRGTRIRPNERKNQYIKVFRYASYIDKPIADINFSIDLYKYSKSSIKTNESMYYLNYNYGLLPKNNTLDMEKPSISKVLDYYEEIVQNGFSLNKDLREDEIRCIKSIGKINKKNIQIHDNKIISPCDSLMPLTQRNNSFRDHLDHKSWLSLFYYIRSLPFDKKVSLLESSVLEKKIHVMKIFKNSIFLIKDRWYHTFNYRKPRHLSYNVSYFIIKQEGMTKKLVNTVGGENIWITCSIEEERRIWSSINPKPERCDDYSLSLIYTFTDDIYRVRINKPGDPGISDKRKHNRGKNIRSYTKDYLGKILEYLLKIQYMYVDEGVTGIFHLKDKLIQNIKWIFLDQDDIIII